MVWVVVQITDSQKTQPLDKKTFCDDEAYDQFFLQNLMFTVHDECLPANSISKKLNPGRSGFLRKKSEKMAVSQKHYKVFDSPKIIFSSITFDALRLALHKVCFACKLFS